MKISLFPKSQKCVMLLVEFYAGRMRLRTSRK